jgi:glutathione S-transferase
MQFESGAILMYLAEKYGPASTPQERARLAAWTHFSNTVCAIAFSEEVRKQQAEEVRRCNQ